METRTIELNGVPVVTKPFVQCQRCHNHFDAQEAEFFTFLGNVNIGTHGGVIGNNFDTQTGELKHVSIYCLKCTFAILQEAIRGDIPRHAQSE
jgi:hypothetical protein